MKFHVWGIQEKKAFVVAEGFEREKRLILICGLAESPRSRELNFYFKLCLLCLCARARCSWSPRPEESNPLELKFQAVVNCLKWVLYWVSNSASGRAVRSYQLSLQQEMERL